MEAHLERARHLLQLSRFTEALSEINKQLAIDPNDSDTLTLASICNLNLNNLKEAEASIQAAITLNPSSPFVFYIYSKILFAKEDYQGAEKRVKEAIALNPFAAENFSWLARIHLHNKDYEEALHIANEGLAIEPDNINCLNTRTIALVKLNKKDEAFATIQDALTEDPHNPSTHANTGWAMLEQRNYKMALQHFYESLRIEPNNEWARSGMIEALKARYWIYRIFLRYMFWIGNLKPQQQWFFIIGIYVLAQILKRLSNSIPKLEWIITPLLIAYGLFAFSTWIIQPLFNLLLFLHPKGRYALDSEERKTSILVGVALAAGLISLPLFFITRLDGFFVATIIGISLALPLSVIYRPSVKRKRTLMMALTVLIFVFGLLSIIAAFANKDYTTPIMIYAVGILGIQFTANYFASR